MASKDRMLRRRPIKPGPVKPKPKSGKRGPAKERTPQERKFIYDQLRRNNDRGFAPKGKPAPGGKRTDPGFGPKNPAPGYRPGMPKKPDPVKPKPPRRDPGFGPNKPAPGYKPGMPKKPGPVKPKPRKLPKGGSIRDLLYRAKPGEVKKQRVEQIRKSKQEQMIQEGKISVMRRPKLNNEKNKLQDMLKGYRSAPDNSKVTYKTRVTPKGPQSMMAAPFRVEKRTVKTGRGR